MGGVHWVGFLMFWPMVKKLLNIEFYSLSLKFLFKSKLIFRGEFGHTPSIVGKPLFRRI
jgi:hypothetical protein